MTIVSTKPYLVRAIYEWCVDQGFTPHIAVLVDQRVMVPPGYASEGQIVLNLGPEATSSLVLGNETITFQARFGGVAHSLTVPVDNVLAVYARENGHGMAFEPEPSRDDGAGTPAHADADSDAEADDGLPPEFEEAEPPQPDDDGGQGQPRPRRGHLKVVK